MADADPLLVRFAERSVGWLERLEDGRFAFRYDPAWLAAPDAFPISLTLPLVDRQWQAGPAQTFFSNLLPEGAVRTAVSQRLGISADNDYGLLAAIGGDCAGALSVAPASRAAAAPGYEPLSDEQLETWLEQWPVLGLATGEGRVQLSLAGAQDKLPVFASDGRLYLPRGDAPSSHLLKLPSRDFAHLPANECFVSLMARRVHLPVAEPELIAIGDHRLCLFPRFDRAPGPASVLVRLHQEDFCQALGLPAQRKYEQEGGPSFSACFDLVAREIADPMPALAALIDWLIFCLLVGNADGHGKNLALLRQADGELDLAPFYDLVCTRAYPRLDRRLAMSIGGQADPGAVAAGHWRQLASEVGVVGRFVRDRVRALADALSRSIDPVCRDFRERFGDSPAIQMITPLVRKQIRRTMDLLV
jgi:serine/threonine-protein kinase HipA